MGVIKCPECGHQTSEKAAICPSCGVEIAGKIVKCTNCGEVFFKEDGLCPHCYRPYQFHQDAIPEEDTTPPADTPDETPIDNDIPDADEGSSPTLPLYVKPSTTVTATDVSNEEPEDDDDDDRPEDTVEEEDSEETAVEDVNEKEDDDDEERFIDTDAEQLERPTQELDPEEENKRKSPKRYIPFIVSMAIAVLIAAVCLYFYNDSKSIRELQAFNSAMDNGDVEQLNSFLRDFTDASDAHKQRVKDEIARLNKQEQDLSLVKVSRDKAHLLQFLKDYPDSPMKKDILATIDSLDWEDATKTNTKAAYEKYIAEHAQGIFFKEAKDKIAVKEVTATEEDVNMARSLFREFFLSVNGNDATRLTNTLSGEMTSFMGTQKPGSGDIVSWMKRQHGENVSSVIWKLNHDYKINKREQNGAQSYSIDFTAKQTIVQKDGRSSSENYRISSDVNERGKILSMSMSKYTPQPGESTPPATKPASSGSSSAKPASSGSSSSKPASSAKPASSGGSSSKPASSAKPASSGSSSSKPASSAKPASSGSSSSKPASSAKPASSGSSSSKPASSAKPASSGSSSSKPASSAKPASSGRSSSKPASSAKPASSGSSSSKPASSAKPSSSGSSSSKPSSSAKPASSAKPSSSGKPAGSSSGSKK